MTATFRASAAFLAWLVLAVCAAGSGRAHETGPPTPSGEELAATQPPLRGSVAFAQEVVENLRNRFDEKQFADLDALQSSLRMSEQARWNAEDSAAPRIAEYHRWQAEQRLLSLLEASPDVLVLDARPGGQKFDPDAPVPLDPHFGVLLLKIVTGDGPTGFRIQPWDMAAEYPLASFPVAIGSGGTDYVLLKVKNAPEEGGASTVSFIPEGSEEPAFWHAITIENRRWGNLAIECLDEYGDPTPVLMRIASREGGRLWEPAGAVDLREQLNDVVPHLSHVGRGYFFFLPGENRGRYWIVPEAVEVAIPEGDWDLRVFHGPEYKPIQRRFTVSAGEWTREKIRLERWVDMPARGWYSGDDHVHARLMSGADAQNLIDYARAVDVHVANILEMGDHLRTYYAQRGFGPEFRVQSGNHVLVPGQEDPRSVLGHAIGLNLRSKVRDTGKYLLNDWVAETIHQQGGLYGHTHMGADACFVHREMALFTPMGIVDFNSIMQADLGTELYYQMLNLGFEMTASAGADTPYGGTIGAVRTYAYLGEGKPFTADAWFDAVQRGNTFVTNGPMIEFRVEGKLPGEQIELSESQSLRVQAKAWGIPGSSEPQSMQLVWNGETVAEAAPANGSDGEAVIEQEVLSGEGGWVAVRVDGRDGSEAHTTPVYVSVRGDRHWDRDKAPALIQRQLAVLEEIEQELAAAERVVAAQPKTLDYWSRTSSEQAAQVRTRLERSRTIYEQLLKELAE